VKLDGTAHYFAEESPELVVHHRTEFFTNTARWGGADPVPAIEADTNP
jgi:hypothetical protein